MRKVFSHLCLLSLNLCLVAACGSCEKNGDQGGEKKAPVQQEVNTAVTTSAETGQMKVALSIQNNGMAPTSLDLKKGKYTFEIRNTTTKPQTVVLKKVGDAKSLLPATEIAPSGVLTAEVSLGCDDYFFQSLTANTGKYPLTVK